MRLMIEPCRDEEGLMTACGKEGVMGSWLAVIADPPPVRVCAKNKKKTSNSHQTHHAFNT